MSDELEAAINKWSSQALLSAWVILQMPDLDGDGDIVIGEADIEHLARYIRTADEQMAALLAACQYGAGNVAGPEALEKVADILEDNTNYFLLADWLREKARIERAAIAKARGED